MIIDDETNMRWVLGRALEQAGYTVHGAANGDEGLALLSRAPIDLVLLDLKLKGEDGLTVLRRLRERRPELVVMLLTAYGTVANAIEAMQLGAADFLRKPFDIEEVTFKVARALERRMMQQELARLGAAQRTAPSFKSLIGASPAWQRMLEQAHMVAQRNENVLLIGEQSTGRRLLAWAIHGASMRSAAPFITYDPTVYQAYARKGALIDQGGAKGAWTEAGEGTLVVTGIEEQAELTETLVDVLAHTHLAHRPRVLIITSNEASLPDSMQQHLPLRLVIPALRERVGDIILLVRHFIVGQPITPAALQAFQHYPWPNNCAELRAVLAGALELAGNEPIDLAHLPEHIRRPPENKSTTPFRLPPDGINLEFVEQTLIRQALERARGNKTKAADLLGLTRYTLLYRMEKYGITGSDLGT